MLVWLLGKKCVSVEKKYSAGSHVFDHMTLIFLYKPINYGVACLLYSVVCSDTLLSVPPLKKAEMSVNRYAIFIIYQPSGNHKRVGSLKSDQNALASWPHSCNLFFGLNCILDIHFEMFTFDCFTGVPKINYGTLPWLASNLDCIDFCDTETQVKIDHSSQNYLKLAGYTYNVSISERAMAIFWLGVTFDLQRLP